MLIAPPTTKNTAAIVVSYYPDTEFRDRIFRLHEQFNNIILVENGGMDTETEVEVSQIAIELIKPYSNIGLASALNLGCQAAHEKGFEWCVSFDQDSNVLPGYLKHMESILSTNPHIKIIGCNYINPVNGKSKYRFNSQFKRQKTIISSGMLFQTSSWFLIGRFRDEFFIDSVDHEFCLRAYDEGVPCYATSAVLLHHSIGNGTGVFGTPIHSSPQRRYTIARNSTVTIIERFKNHKLWAIKRCISLLVECTSILLIEREKAKRFRLFFKGLKDGFLKASKA